MGKLKCKEGGKSKVPEITNASLKYVTMVTMTVAMIAACEFIDGQECEAKRTSRI